MMYWFQRNTFQWFCATDKRCQEAHLQQLEEKMVFSDIPRSFLLGKVHLFTSH